MDSGTQSIGVVRSIYFGECFAGLYDNERTNPIVGLLQRLRDPALA